MDRDKFSIFLQEQNRGRVDLSNYQGKPFELNQDLGINKNRDFGESIKNIHQETLTAQAFFSRRNIEYIQQEIIDRVYKQSNNKYKIGRQNETELEIIMRSIYLQNTQSLPCDIKGQILKLNELVLDYAVPQIIGEVSQYSTYLRDISEAKPVMDRPTNVSIKGEKTLTPNLGFVSFSNKPF